MLNPLPLDIYSYIFRMLFYSCNYGIRRNFVQVHRISAVACFERTVFLHRDGKCIITIVAFSVTQS